MQLCNARSTPDNSPKKLIDNSELSLRLFHVVTVAAGSDANQHDREHCMIANYTLPSVSRDLSLIFAGLTGMNHGSRYLL